MNLGDIRTRVQRQFGDTSGAQILEADIDRWANDAQVDIVRRTEALQEKTQVNTVAGQETYPVPANFLLVKRVTHDGLLLMRTTLDELDALAGNRQEAAFTGVPKRYFVWDNEIGLYPLPEASGVSNLDIWYIRTPATLAAPADIPEIPVFQHEDIVTFCLIRAKQLNEDFDQAAKYEQEYERRLGNAMYESMWPHADEYPAVRSLPGDDF